MRRHLTCLAFLALLAAADAHAGDPIATDRPDFVESSNTVGQGRFQIETSVAWERDGDARLFSTPTLFRLGISPNWELRLESDGWMRASVDGDHGTGLADVAIGAKYHVAGSEDRGPSLGWLVHADLPSGAAGFRGHGVRPSLRFVAEWELEGGYSLGLMPGLAYQSDDTGRRYTAGIFGVVVGKSWNDRFRTFAELALPQIASGADGGTVATLDLGGAWLVNDDVQLDLAYSGGLNRYTPDHALTLGVSVRF